tara:strand:- start:173 stop:1675 length:1503 start_codon:yes stop_codon:yes gene_type:complete
MFNIIKLNEKDNIGIAPMNIPENAKLSNGIKSINNVPYGHKISLQEIKKGDFIIRYGQIIGISSNDIQKGEHVHSHNLTFYESERNYTNKFEEDIVDKSKEQKYFKGYKRNNGSSGTRNYIGLISTVNCSATVVKKIADKVNHKLKKANFVNIDGAVCLKHASGCGMNNTSYGMTVFNRTIEGFKIHPNFAKVYVIGLGCECAQISLYNNDQLTRNVEYLNIQDEGGTKDIIDKVSSQIINQLEKLNSIEREDIPISELTVALQCGGSDSYSGITANPALGIASDIIVDHGGSSILSETPEIYGAEHLLFERSLNKSNIHKIEKQIQWWKDYLHKNGSTMDNNPSPGNKRGGLTTILEKSLGAVAKSGTRKMVDVLDYAEKLKVKGFNFMNSPGYDPVSVTGQVASGANIICFTTGRGSCFGFKPAPSIKIATNTNMFNKLKEDMDVNAGSIMDNEKSLDDVGKEIFNKILSVASGERSKSEINEYGDDEFNPWIIDPTL